VSELLTPDTSRLRAALDAARTSGYSAGLLTAAEQTPGIAAAVGGVAIPGSTEEWSAFWDQWRPGNAPAATLLDDGGLAALLASSDATVKGIEGTLLDGLGSRLADGVSRGLSTDEIARTLTDYVNDPVRAAMIAQTETARAVSAASRDAYGAAGIAQVDWLVSPGACNICQGYADDGPYSLQTLPEEPAHPNCRCSYAPRDPGMTASHAAADELTAEPVGAAAVVSAGTSDATADALSAYTGEAPLGSWAKGGMQKYVQEDLMSQARSISGQPLAALSEYIDNDMFTPVNAYLRGDRSVSSSDVKSIISGIDKALQGTSTMSDGVVFRGVPASAFDELKVGKVLTDPGYMSTSVNPSSALAFASYEDEGVVLRLTVPAGSRALAVDGLNTDSVLGESEIILPRGTSMKITKIAEAEGKRIVYAKVVPGA